MRCGWGAGDSGILQEGDRGTVGLWILKKICKIKHYIAAKTDIVRVGNILTVNHPTVDRQGEGRVDLSNMDQ